MLLSREKNFIFVKGKKVAGTSIEVHLAPQLEEGAIVTPIERVGPSTHRPCNYEVGSQVFSNHMTARKIAAFIGEEQFKTMHSWGIVRHPVEKVLSFYFMQVGRNLLGYTLDDAILAFPSEASRYCDSEGRNMLTTVLRYEELSVALPDFLAKFGLSADGFDSV